MIESPVESKAEVVGPALSEERVAQLVDKMAALDAEIGKVVIGQRETRRQLLMVLLAGGHCLLEGVPGLAKTLMVRTLAQATRLSFKRIQFTPDLMPTDIVGTDILEEDATTGRRSFRFEEGPVFANLLLADEINRSPPKAQAALLEAMQEREVSHGGATYTLPQPFFVLATQNPIEQAGTYPLPEAQLDRFLLYLKVEYPTAEEEVEVLAATTSASQPRVEPVIDAEALIEAQGLVRQVHISRDLTEYVASLVRATRPGGSSTTTSATTRATTREWIDEFVDWGAGPRAGQAMILAAKAGAFLAGRFAVTQPDIAAVVAPVLRHRVLLNFRAQAEAITADEISRRLLEAIPRPSSPLR